MSKKFLSIILALVLTLGLLPTVGVAAVNTSSAFSDMPDNWATEALESAVANGLLVGDSGKIMPDSPLTRAQMATIIAREFGARFDALWAQGAGGVGSRANVMSILRDVTERLDKTIRHERHICEANEEATL